MKTILCYGDSNTWGYMPCSGKRFPADKRWTGVMAAELGEDYLVLEDGINGRTTVWDEPYTQCRNGLKGLGYAIERTRLLDLVIVMLGSNDLNYTDAYGYYKGISVIASHVLHADVFHPGTEPAFAGEPRLLLVSPILLDEQVAVKRPEIHMADKYGECVKFAAYTEQVARELGAEWMNAACYAHPEEKDCLHMDAENHGRLGRAIARKVKEILA